jgi:DNA invertase Pin-like site-specific DNA recombinase
VERQERLCRDLADELGWEITHVLVDNDISAFSGKRRPQYEELLRLIKSGEIEAVMAYHPDRLYRRMTDLVQLTDVLRQHPVHVRTVQGGEIDLSTATGVLQAHMTGAVAQHESARTGERVKAKKSENARKGLHVAGGHRPYGFVRTGPGQLAPEPFEAEIIAEMASRVLAGATVRSLVHDLNDRGVTTVGGFHWRDTSLRNVLTSPRVAGLVPYQGEAVAEANWDPIIPRDQWERLCSVLEARPRGRKPRSFLLSGFVYCGRCGYRLHSNTSGANGDPRQRRRYKCERDVDPKACGSVIVESRRVEAEVVNRVLMVARGLNLAEVRAERSIGESQRLTAAIADDEQLLAELGTDVGQRRITRAEFLNAREPIEKRIKANRAMLSRLGGAEQLPPELARIDHATFGALDFDAKRAVLQLFVARIYVDPARGRSGFEPDRVRVEWRA